MRDEIDYDAVDAVLQERREKSLDYLIGAIERCRDKV